MIMSFTGIIGNSVTSGPLLAKSAVFLLLISSLLCSATTGCTGVIKGGQDKTDDGGPGPDGPLPVDPDGTTLDSDGAAPGSDADAGECVPVCDGVPCGQDDACGNPCMEGSGCQCVPSCADKLCGENDGCGDSCQPGSGCCMPACVGKLCGADNGCGSPCQAGSGCIDQCEGTVCTEVIIAETPNMQTTSWDSRLIYDMGGPINCGEIEVVLTNFHPRPQYVHGSPNWDCNIVDCYVHFVALYEGLHGYHWDASNNNESQISLQATAEGSWRDDMIKLKPVPCNWYDPLCASATPYSHSFAWNTSEQYTMKVRWSHSAVQLSINSVHQASQAWSWPPSHPAPYPGLRYLFVGRDHNITGGYLNGPIYQSVTVRRCE